MVAHAVDHSKRRTWGTDEQQQVAACVHACVRACVRACVQQQALQQQVWRACVRACENACVCVSKNRKAHRVFLTSRDTAFGFSSCGFLFFSFFLLFFFVTVGVRVSGDGCGHRHGAECVRARFELWPLAVPRALVACLVRNAGAYFTADTVPNLLLIQ